MPHPLLIHFPLGPQCQAASGDSAMAPPRGWEVQMGKSVHTSARSFGIMHFLSGWGYLWCRWNSPTTRQGVSQQKLCSASDINPRAGRNSSLSSGGVADSHRHETMFINDLQWGPVTPHYGHPSRACSSLFISPHQSPSVQLVIRTCIDSWSICFVRPRENTAGYAYTWRRLSDKVCGCVGGCGRRWWRDIWDLWLCLQPLDMCPRDSFLLGPPWQLGSSRSGDELRHPVLSLVYHIQWLAAV